MQRLRKCPKCRAPLQPQSHWLGLVKRLPRACEACGTKLLYDTAGGVYEQTPPTDGTLHPDPSERDDADEP